MSKSSEILTDNIVVTDAKISAWQEVIMAVIPSFFTPVGG